MLEIRDVRKNFGTTEVLKGVSFDVAQGDVVAILGPSGSGKTTLLRCINFLETADSGTMIFDGEEYRMNHSSKKEIARFRQKTAFVFQNYNLFLNKTALENVTEGLIIARKMPKKQAAEIGRAALDKVGLSDKYHFYPDELSGGQQQRVAIARALVGQPAILLADEPTGALDRNSGKEVLKLFQRLHDMGNTIVMITHDLGVAEHAERVVRIVDGELFGVSDTRQ